MILDAGITTVSSAGTAVRVLNTTSRVRSAQFKALAANSGITYLGISDVSASIGYELSAGNTVELNFGEQGGAILANSLYVDAASSGDKVSWLLILDG